MPASADNFVDLYANEVISDNRHKKKGWAVRATKGTTQLG
jgi:hypothetical protein